MSWGVCSEQVLSRDFFFKCPTFQKGLVLTGTRGGGELSERLEGVTLPPPPPPPCADSGPGGIFPCTCPQ